MDLAIIILSFNTKDITKRCLLKLLEAKKYCEQKLNNKIEVIVLDNASTDGSLQMLKQDFPRVKLISSKINTGFSKGNNIAMKKSRNPFILLLNSDVYVEEDSLYKTLAYFRVNLNCDVMGARLNYPTGKLQPSAGNLPNPLNLIFWILGLDIVFPFHPKFKGYFSKAHEAGWVMGAFLALRRKVFDQVGGFDENFFMHMEEVEWCKRIKNAGFGVWYVPQVEVVHLHGASTKFDLQSSFLNELKGMKYYLNKHYGNLYFLVKIFLILGLVLRVIAFSFLGKAQRARIYME